jgi:hypothetical protein
MSINAGDADLETPPDALARTFMPSKKTLSNPLRSPAITTPATTVNPPLPPPQTPSPYFQFPPPSYPYYPYPPNTQYPQLPPQLPPPYIHPQYTAAAIPSPPTVKRSHHRSSSFSSDYEVTSDKLSEYFTWLIKINPTMTEQLTQCLTKLQAENIIYGTLSNVSDALFEKWKISDGLALMARSYQKKWEHAKTRGRA